MATQPVLVVGLDGVPFRYLDRFDDRLPTIRRLRETGFEAPLESIHPPWTGCAWPSMYTGVDPSHHGVYDFFDFRGTYPDDADVITRQDVRAPAVWEYLTERDRRSVVVNVPVTHPATELEGVLLPGYLAPEDEEGYPPGIRAELSSAVGREYRIYSEHETASKSAEKIDGYERLIRHRAEAAAHLLETEPWDFAFVQVQKTDAVFHNSDSERDFRRIYEAADDLIARLIDACEEEPNVIVCSDHGIGPVTGHTVYVNELLRENGYIETTSEATRATLAELKGDGTADERPVDEAVARLAALGQRVGVTPASVYRAAERVGLETVLERVVPEDVQRSAMPGIDWRNSKAFCRRASELGIRINLEGRDPDGVVPQARYEEVRDDVIDLLSSLEVEPGEPAFEFVERREEVYDGPYAEDACDVLFRPTDMNNYVSAELAGRRTIPVDTYNHKRTGVLVAAGPDVESGTGETRSLLDVAPAIFSLLGEPVPERMQGEVPAPLASTSVDRAPYDATVGADETYEQDQTEVTERLSDLGYL
ncbi:alkaline phosphatase family protein [Natrialbaceae archaeon GCM10025810]|uniref:alkaline phosphatase family protein n=1 Tax=Halovalidus salilacus TaxID=3075124 RepID=UPI003611F3B0